MVNYDFVNGITLLTICLSQFIIVYLEDIRATKKYHGDGPQYQYDSDIYSHDFLNDILNSEYTIFDKDPICKLAFDYLEKYQYTQHMSYNVYIYLVVFMIFLFNMFTSIFIITTYTLYVYTKYKKKKKTV